MTYLFVHYGEKIPKRDLGLLKVAASPTGRAPGLPAPTGGCDVLRARQGIREERRPPPSTSHVGSNKLGRR
jgi:hypothetical protein